MIGWWAVPVLAASVQVAAPQVAGPRVAIEAAMADSAAGWNAGDLDRFLRVYSDDPATSFTGSKGVVRGKAAIRAKYVKDYAAVFGPAAKRDAIPRLSFAFEDVRMLGDGYALLTARWRLGAGGEGQIGMTTLVFRREADGWRIIADHSS